MTIRGLGQASSPLQRVMEGTHTHGVPQHDRVLGCCSARAWSPTYHHQASYRACWRLVVAMQILILGIVQILVITSITGFIPMHMNFKPPEFGMGLAIFACSPTSLSQGGHKGAAAGAWRECRTLAAGQDSCQNSLAMGSCRGAAQQHRLTARTSPPPQRPGRCPQAPAGSSAAGWCQRP